MVAKLTITKADKTTSVQSKPNVVTIVKADHNSTYAFKDGNNLAKKPQIKKNGNDLWVFDDQNTSDNPDIIIEHYYDYYPNEDVMLLEQGVFGQSPELQKTTATDALAPAMPLESGVHDVTPLWKTLATGALLVGGGIALKGGHSQHKEVKIDPNLNDSRINITKIGDNFGIKANGVTQAIRIKGEATFEGYEGVNAKFVRQVELKIGEKTYTAGVDNGKFHLDVAQSELAKLNGQPMTYKFFAENWKLDENNQPKQLGKGTNIALDNQAIKSFSLDDGFTNKTDDGKYVLDAHHTTTVSGVVTGTAKAGDSVTVQVGDKTYKTTVDEHQAFSVAVNTNELQQLVGDGATVVANLMTKDSTGQDMTVSDQQSYVKHGLSQVDNPFVSHNGLTPIPETYFVSELGQAKTYNSWFLYANPERHHVYDIPPGGYADGKTATIKYFFASSPKDYQALTENPIIAKNNHIHINPKTDAKLVEQHFSVKSIEPFTDKVKGVIRDSFNKIGSFVNVKFEETTDITQANTHLFYADFLDKDGNGSNKAIGTAAHSSYLWWNKIGDSPEYLVKYGALHEITHTLGMMHSHESYKFKKLDRFPEYKHYYEESPEFTYMSYHLYGNDGAMTKFGNLRMFDLAALHYQLGVNKQFHAGNDVYTFKEYNMYTSDGDIYIWDGDGVDTFDASLEQKGVTVDLTPGSWSYIGEKLEKEPNLAVAEQVLHYEPLPADVPETRRESHHQGVWIENTYTDGRVFIGYGTQIENAIGTAYNDKLTGNNANNNIYGGDGDDRLDGGKGDDYLEGGQGDDTYVIDSKSDIIIEYKNGGTDTVETSTHYTLGENLENLTVIGNLMVLATGNELNNTITANKTGNTLFGMGGDDRLIGNVGVDMMTGGEGKDTFVFNTKADKKAIDVISDFIVGDDMIELAVSAFTGLEKFKGDADKSRLFEDGYLNYNKETGVLSYDVDGKDGHEKAVDFVNIGTNLHLDPSVFVIV